MTIIVEMIMLREKRTLYIFLVDKKIRNKNK